MGAGAGRRYVNCAKHLGQKVPLVRDVVRLEESCRRTMAVWARRQAADDAAAHVASGVVRDDTALQWMVSVAHTYDNERAAGGASASASASSPASASASASSSASSSSTPAAKCVLPCHSREAATAFLALRVKKAPAEQAADGGGGRSAAAIARILNGSLQSVRHVGPTLSLLENGGLGRRGEGGGTAGTEAGGFSEPTTSGSNMPADDAEETTPVFSASAAAAAAAAAEAEAPAQTVEMLLRSHGWRFTYEPRRVLFEQKAPRLRAASAAAANPTTLAASQSSAPPPAPTPTRGTAAAAGANKARRRKKK